MKTIKKEIKLLYIFTIVFLVCSFIMLSTITIIFSKKVNNSKKNDFETISKSVVSIESYKGLMSEKLGSGFIYKTDDKNAYILTNNHVVENSTDVKIYLSEKDSVNGEIIGYSSNFDVAVIRIENKNYKALSIAKDNNIKMGDTVYTIGTPLSHEFFNSLSSGVISKTSRFRFETNSNENTLMNMIQTDIVTNPGNSGGPLFNEKLEVIGICTSNIETSNISGISFAIPISQIINKLDDLEKGELKTPKIGKVEIVDKTDSEILYSNGLIEKTSEKNGVIVIKDDEESNLKKGDVITKINNDEIMDIYYFNYYLNKYEKDDNIKLTIIRNNKEKIIKVKLK